VYPVQTASPDRIARRFEILLAELKLNRSPCLSVLACLRSPHLQRLIFILNNRPAIVSHPRIRK
jgi:hypothetical protein